MKPEGMIQGGRVNLNALHEQTVEIEHRMRDLILEERLIDGAIARYAVDGDRPRSKRARKKLEDARADGLIEITRLREAHEIQIALRDGVACP